ncbi:MAG: 3-isopropylmalate dehydratase [Kiloniellales bacterium]|nr:3-isopropylmalate dehydratase [Kiloniellales bacterium]
MTAVGHAWVFGDDVDTDSLAPGAFMKGPIEDLAAHCLESLDPNFAAGVTPGDVLVAGRNFGMGSSREQAVEALKRLGVAGVVARSFAGIFYRNAINLGLPVLVSPDPVSVAAGDDVSLDVRGARLVNRSRDTVVALEPLPDFLLALLSDGGLVPHLERKLAARRKPEETLP